MDRRDFLRVLGIAAVAVPVLTVAEVARVAAPRARQLKVWADREILTAADLNHNFDALQARIG